MEWLFELSEKNVIVNRDPLFTNGYSFQASEWEGCGNVLAPTYPAQVPDPSNRTETIFLSSHLNLYDVLGGLAPNTIYRGAVNFHSTAVKQGVSFNGMWWRSRRQVFEVGESYDITVKVDYIIDDSVGLGLPIGSLYWELRFGTTGSVIGTSNTTGTFTYTMVADDTTILFNTYACRACVTMLKCEKSVAPAYVEVSNPFNIQELSIVAEEDPIMRGIFVKYIDGVMFVDDAYSFLKTLYAEYGSLGMALCRISYRDISTAAWTQFYEGEISFADSEWDENDCFVKVVITPIDGIGAIFTKSNVEISAWDHNSLNGTPISRSLINSGGGGVTLANDLVIPIGYNIAAWYFHDFLDYAIRWVTNDQASLYSPVLGGTWNGYPSNGTFAYYGVTTGGNIRQIDGAGKTTIQETINAAIVAFGLYFKQEEIGGDKKLSAYELSLRYDSGNQLFSFNDVNATREDASEIKYSDLKFGYKFPKSDSTTQPGIWTDIQLKFGLENSGSVNADFTTEYVAANIFYHNQYNLGGGTTYEDDDDRMAILELDPGTFNTKALKVTDPWGESWSVAYMNEDIGFYRAYDRHRPIIYESANISGKASWWVAGWPFPYPNMLDFYGEVTWFKAPPNSNEFYFKWKYLFDVPFSITDFETALTDFEKYVEINDNTFGTKVGYLRKITWKMAACFATLEIITED